MRKGHVTGHKRERKHNTEWYRVHEQAHIDRITKEYAAKQALAQYWAGSISASVQSQEPIIIRCP